MNSRRTIDDYIAKRNINPVLVDEEIESLRRREEAYRLAEVRRARDMTQMQLAEKLGVSQKRVSQVEHGKVGNLKLSTLERYASAMGGKLHVVIDFPGETEVALEG